MSTEDKKSPAQTPNEACAETMESTLRRIAHELRTPIGAIGSSADIMNSEAFGPLGDERYKDYARSIGQSAEFALNIIAQAIDDIGTSEQTQSELTGLDAIAVVIRSLEQVQPFADDAGVILKSDLLEAPLDVYSDPVKLQQIIINAVANAIKFSPVGSTVTISVGLRGSKNVEIVVTDQGLGMGPAELERVRKNKSESGQGYGLMYRLGHQSGAEIAVESTLGGGTTVTIKLAKMASA